MSTPLKNHSVKEIEAAFAAAMLALTGSEATVQIDALEFVEGAGRVDVKVCIWRKSGPLIDGAF